MYDVLLSRGAARRLKAMAPGARTRVLKALERARGDPLRGKKLRGELEGLFSLRVGQVRVVYEVDPDEKVIVVHGIGPRGDVYKK
jgi:mRNA-degrading endonuclease RelE of RelBE toxin-antitoxin system